MIEIIGLRFKTAGKIYYFDPNGKKIRRGTGVIVDTVRGMEYGICEIANRLVEEDPAFMPVRKIIRIANDRDRETLEKNRAREEEAFGICLEKINKHGLGMKLIDVELTFDTTKIIFYFTAEGRVDFRELVKELAGVFRMRIELRQIGVRDEAKMLGGLGICGRAFCCSQFLTEFHPVSIKMAKTQGLSLNPAKISGACGRLMCCLKYEEHAYEDIVKKSPKIDAFVETPYGKGSVISKNLLRGIVKVRLEDGNDTTLKTFTFDELSVLGGKGRRAEYIAAKAEGKLEEAGFKPSAPPPKPSSSIFNPPPAFSDITATTPASKSAKPVFPFAKKTSPPIRDSDVKKPIKTEAKTPKSEVDQPAKSKKSYFKRFKGRGKNK